ncbi:hypothetical protein YDYSY3_00520 [Paenibacillus chitinolyticus]|nr:hypothetical protein YDYSY3_00520 [Paenibacillus chitinolyticus]
MNEHILNTYITFNDKYIEKSGKRVGFSNKKHRKSERNLLYFRKSFAYNDTNQLFCKETLHEGTGIND